MYFNMKKNTSKIMNDFNNKIDINCNYTICEFKKILFYCYDNNYNTSIKLIHEKPLLNK